MFDTQQHIDLIIALVQKGGVGSGRYPKGSHGHMSEIHRELESFHRDEVKRIQRGPAGTEFDKIDEHELAAKLHGIAAADNEHVQRTIDEAKISPNADTEHLPERKVRAEQFTALANEATLKLRSSDVVDTVKNKAKLKEMQGIIHSALTNPKHSISRRN